MTLVSLYGQNHLKPQSNNHFSLLVSLQMHLVTNMSPAFIPGCHQHLPDYAITFDKFYLVKGL